MEEHVVKSKCGGAQLKINIRKDKKVLVQNLTKRKKFNTKGDML